MTIITSDIERFTEAIRERFPEVIRAASDGEVEQVEDRQLLVWTANGEDAFQITLSDGAEYQITVKQVAWSREGCNGCAAEMHPDESTDDGTGRALCPTCWDAMLDAYERQADVPGEHPYDDYGRAS